MEVSERKFPVKVEAYGLREGSGGAGAFRGGLGVRRATRLLADVRLVANFERSQCLPWGLDGGQPGEGSFIEIHLPGDRGERLQKCTNYALPAGSRVVYFTGGGGGYGDPRARAIERVMDDVRRGFITPAEAENDYAVCINQDSGRVDEAKTRSLRASHGRSDDAACSAAADATETCQLHARETRKDDHRYPGPHLGEGTRQRSRRRMHYTWHPMSAELLLDEMDYAGVDKCFFISYSAEDIWPDLGDAWDDPAANRITKQYFLDALEGNTDRLIWFTDHINPIDRGTSIASGRISMRGPWGSSCSQPIPATGRPTTACARSTSCVPSATCRSSWPGNAGTIRACAPAFRTIRSSLDLFEPVARDFPSVRFLLTHWGCFTWGDNWLANCRAPFPLLAPFVRLLNSHENLSPTSPPSRSSLAMTWRGRMAG